MDMRLFNIFARFECGVLTIGPITYYRERLGGSADQIFFRPVVRMKLWRA